MKTREKSPWERRSYSRYPIREYSAHEKRCAKPRHLPPRAPGAEWRVCSRESDPANALLCGGERSGLACPVSSRVISGPRTIVLPQQAGADQSEKGQNREHRAHTVPEIPGALVRGPRASQLARGCVGCDASELLVHRHVHEDRKQEATPNVEYAGQRDEPEAARPGPRGVGCERRDEK